MLVRCSRRPPALGVLLLAACSTASYSADADAEVDAILAEATERTLAARETSVLQPEVEPPVPPPPAEAPPVAPAPPAAASAADTYDLARALATAVAHNREFLARRESLYRSGLSLSQTRFDFGPQFAAAIDYLWPQAEGGIESHRTGASWSVGQILPTGGRIALNAGLDAEWPFGPGSGDPSYGTSAAVTLTQPLLRGAGYGVAWEPLTQAERELTYAVRDFELYRQGFTIGITQQFFELASQRKTLANEDRNYESAVFDRKKAEALQQVGRNSEQEVFRARRREIEAKDQLINARAAYDRAVDAFKIQLGLPTTVRIELDADDPPYEPVRWTVDSAIAAARNNRLDLISARQRLEDSERSLRLVENSLLPDLDLTASYGLAGAGDDLGHAAPDQWSASVGLAFTVPLQQKAERNAWRSAQISLAQARRSLQLQEDQLDLDIRDALRRLKSLEERIVLQQDQIEQERRAVTVTEIRYEAGQVDNRDLLEARQALVDAQNALIRLYVEHFVGRLNLLRDMGLFFVDDRGMWR